MRMEIRFVVGILLPSVFLQLTDGSFHLEFQINQYNNPSKSLANGWCCEPWSLCWDPCDTEFEEICLGPGGSSDNCPWSEHVLSPGSVGGSSIQFTDTIGSVSNPFSFTVAQLPPNGFQLYVKVIDDDGIFGTELIDEIYLQIPPTLDVVVTSQSVTGSYEKAVLTMGYSLTCTQNYYGSDCSTYCVPSDNSMGHYTCDPSNGNKICLQGYQNPESDCTEVACALVCTGEGGSCSESGVCECSQGWSGVDCGTAQCAENCHSEGGYCNVPGECFCNDNWNGTNCDQFQCHPDCSTVGGTCVTAGECVCLPDYTGEYCETDLNPCAHLSPCENEGVCSNEGPNQYSCACPSGYTGMDCEEDIDECEMSPCANQATCIDHLGDYQCLCVLGWTGVDCKTDIDDCSPQPCQNGGNCSDLLNGYYCTCEQEYEGLNCEQKVNACVPYPCQNGGSCTNFVTNYTCHCLPEFTGGNCEISLASSATKSVVTQPLITQPSITQQSITQPSIIQSSNTQPLPLTSMYTTITPEAKTDANQGVVGSIVGATAGILLFATALVAVTVAIYIVTRRKRRAKAHLPSMQYDGTSGNLSAISPNGGIDNMTYTALPEKSHFSTAYAQPMNDLEQETEIYKEVDNPLYGIGQGKPEANGDMQHSTAPNSDFQPTNAHYESVHLEGLNPMYASVSLEVNGNAAAHYTSDQDEHYSQIAQDK